MAVMTANDDMSIDGEWKVICIVWHGMACSAETEMMESLLSHLGHDFVASSEETG